MTRVSGKVDSKFYRTFELQMFYAEPQYLAAAPKGNIYDVDATVLFFPASVSLTIRAYDRRPTDFISLIENWLITPRYERQTRDIIIDLILD